MTDVEVGARCGLKDYDWMLTKSALLQAKTVHWATAAKINLNIFSLRDAGVEDEDRAVTDVKLFGKNHWYLRIQDDGSVTGTREQRSEEGKEFFSVS